MAVHDDVQQMACSSGRGLVGICRQFPRRANIRYGDIVIEEFYRLLSGLLARDKRSLAIHNDR